MVFFVALIKVLIDPIGWVAAIIPAKLLKNKRQELRVGLVLLIPLSITIALGTAWTGSFTLVSVIGALIKSIVVLLIIRPSKKS
jgi:hypothetical protein